MQLSHLKNSILKGAGRALSAGVVQEGLPGKRCHVQVELEQGLGGGRAAFPSGRPWRGVAGSLVCGTGVYKGWRGEWVERGRWWGSVGPGFSAGGMGTQRPLWGGGGTSGPGLQQDLLKPSPVGSLFSRQQGTIFEKLGICTMPQFVRFMHDLKPVKEDPDVVATNLCFGTVPVRLYQPKAASRTPRRGVIFYHGGGGVFGSLSKSPSPRPHLARGVIASEQGVWGATPVPA